VVSPANFKEYSPLLKIVVSHLLWRLLAIKKLKSCKSPGIDQTLAELIKAGSRTIRGTIYKLIIGIWNKEELPEEWKESVIGPIHKKGIKPSLITIGA